jgi:tetratricopeptide (TPR) repeat protein
MLDIESEVKAIEEMARRGREPEGLVALDKLIEQAPADWRLWSARAYVLGRQGRYVEKASDLTHAISLCEVEEPDLFFQRGRALYACGDLQAAVDDFSRVILIELARQSEYYHSTALAHRASVFLTLGDPSKALSDLDEIGDDDIVVASPRGLQSVGDMRRLAKKGPD